MNGCSRALPDDRRPVRPTAVPAHTSMDGEAMAVVRKGRQ